MTKDMIMDIAADQGVYLEEWEAEEILYNTLSLPICERTELEEYLNEYAQDEAA